MYTLECVASVDEQYTADCFFPLLYRFRATWMKDAVFSSLKL